ncbi:MAG: hypothetical protein IH861_13325 [Chloroflexi bacterium]|nr:hypothetical protein [Chloroflexota bacterium]
MEFDRDALAREIQSPSSDILDLAELPYGTLLEKFLFNLRELIESEGLTDLYWVTGIHTEDIASSLLQALEIGGLVGDASVEKFCIVARPSDFAMVEMLSSRYGMKVSTMSDFYFDSFLVVNEKMVLDVTPVATDDGDPEHSSDPTIVSLYLGLFNMLRNSAIPSFNGG